MLLGLAVPGCYLVSFHILWSILRPHPPGTVTELLFWCQQKIVYTTWRTTLQFYQKEVCCRRLQNAFSANKGCWACEALFTWFTVAVKGNKPIAKEGLRWMNPPLIFSYLVQFRGLLRSWPKRQLRPRWWSPKKPIPHSTTLQCGASPHSWCFV